MSEQNMVVQKKPSATPIEVGNEHSTFDNPYGIMNESSYNVYVDFANYCGITTGRQYVSYEQANAFYITRKNYLTSLKKQAQNLRTQPQTLQSKIDIDNIYLKINPLESGLREFSFYVANIFKKVLKKQKGTFSKVVKTTLEYKFKGYRCSSKSSSATVKNEYKEIIDSIGTEALKLGNKYLK